MYLVVDDCNTYVTVTDDDIEHSLKEDRPLKREIIMAMGLAHKKAYLPYLYLYLDDEDFFIRRDAAQSIFLIDGKEGLQHLKKRDQKLDETDLSAEPSEKALLQAMIMRIEEGTEGVYKYFFAEDGNEMIKYDLLAYYTEGYLYEEEDLKLIVELLNAYIEKTLCWIKKLPRDEYEEVILFALESIWFIKDSTSLLKHMKEQLSNQLYHIFCSIIQMKFDMDGLELIAEITEGMCKNDAVRILQKLKGKTRGDAKRAYQNALKFWKIEE